LQVRFLLAPMMLAHIPGLFIVPLRSPATPAREFFTGIPYARGFCLLFPFFAVLLACTSRQQSAIE